MLKKILFICVFITANISYTYACTLCDTSEGNVLRYGILANDLLFTLFTIFALFLLFGFICYGISQFFRYQHVSFPGLLLGGSLAGLIDGILFHQILQFHSMIANKLPLTNLVNIEINMFWDGIFHAFTFTMLVISILILWQSIKDRGNNPSSAYFFGSILIGGGMFNIIEGIVDHEVLQLHHVYQKSTPIVMLYSDITFLVVSLIVTLIGIKILRMN